MLGRAEDREANKPEREKCVAGGNTGRWKHLSPLTQVPELHNLEFARLVNYFLTKPQFLHSGMVMYIVCHCVFKCENCFRILSVVTVKEI